MLKATVSEHADLVEVAKALLSGKTVRLRLEWPKSLRGEQPLEVDAPDVEEPLRLLAKRAGGRVTAQGRLLRARPLDSSEGERLERFVADDELPEEDEPADQAPAEEEPPQEEPPEEEPPEEEPAEEEPPEEEPAEEEPPEEEPAEEEPPEDEPPESASFGEVRTGRTLPPPAMPRPIDDGKGGTLPPPSLKLPQQSPVEAEAESAPDSDEEIASEEEGEPSFDGDPEADAGSDSWKDDDSEEEVESEEDSDSGPESSPEIEFRLASLIPPELLAEEDDDEAGTESEDDAADDEESSQPEPPPEPNESDDMAALEAAAQSLLAGESSAVEHLLLDAEEQGARALCRARVDATASARGRSRFLSCMRELGDAAVSAIGEALDAALSAAIRSGNPTALEDLLRAIPELEDDELARSLLPMCTHHVAAVRHAAVAALPKVLGERSKPVLRDALSDEDETVCRAAIDGLRRVRGIDVLVLVRLEPILTGDADASDELRAIAAAALVDVDVEQRSGALDALHRALNPRTSMVNLFIKADEEKPMLVEAICSTMLVIGGSKERRTVSKHAARSRQPLRQRLEALLRRHS